MARPDPKKAKRGSRGHANPASSRFMDAPAGRARSSRQHAPSMIVGPNGGRILSQAAEMAEEGEIIRPPSPVIIMPSYDLTEFGTQAKLPNGVRKGMGWCRDLPDIRDATLERLAPKFETSVSSTQQHVFKKSVGPIQRKAGTEDLPAKVDNSDSCSPVEDQQNLGSCTAHACVGMVEYMECRAGGPHVDASHLFLYKVTRKLLNWTGDTGAFLRSTMKALVVFGVPPEQCWPYDITTYEREPDAYMYSYAANYKAIQYFRLDSSRVAPKDILIRIKSALSTGYAIMFGFSVYSSLSDEPDIPFPSDSDVLQGGHAVLAVGYDDERPVRQGARRNGNTKGYGKGALLIRNSWGTEWGDGGYGWLPYEYVMAGLADDFWTCTSQAWIESGQFD